MDFYPFARAGLRQNEISKVLNVSHNSVGLWLRGKRQPHPLLEDRITSMLETVEAAVEAGKLPLPPHIPRDERMQHITKILKVRTRQGSA